jgi:hypothetical protein
MLRFHRTLVGAEQPSGFLVPLSGRLMLLLHRLWMAAFN